MRSAIILVAISLLALAAPVEAAADPFPTCVQGPCAGPLDPVIWLVQDMLFWVERNVCWNIHCP